MTESWTRYRIEQALVLPQEKSNENGEEGPPDIATMAMEVE
jgi:hypothetical protein